MEPINFQLRRKKSDSISTFADMSTLERVATANLGVMIALNMTKPATPAKHLLREAKKVYSYATSRVERWLVAMDKDYFLRIVMWHFSRSFEELKTAILNDLDQGYESLQFVMQIAPKFMSSTLNSALQQVSSFAQLSRGRTHIGTDTGSSVDFFADEENCRGRSSECRLVRERILR